MSCEQQQNQIYTCMYVHMHMYIFVYRCIDVHMYVHMYACTYVCMVHRHLCTDVHTLRISIHGSTHAHTCPLSVVGPNMTMQDALTAHTILQNSSSVASMGPSASMYWLFLWKPCMKAQGHVCVMCMSCV